MSNFNLYYVLVEQNIIVVFSELIASPVEEGNNVVSQMTVAKVP